MVFACAVIIAAGYVLLGIKISVKEGYIRMRREKL